MANIDLYGIFLMCTKIIIHFSATIILNWSEDGVLDSIHFRKYKLPGLLFLRKHFRVVRLSLVVAFMLGDAFLTVKNVIQYIFRPI